MPNTRNVTIAVGQFDVKQGDVQANLDKMLSMADQAADRGADIICFPELAYTGYFLSSHELQCLAQTQTGSFAEALSAKAKERKIHIIAGYAEKVDVPGKMYNSCLFFDDEGNLIANMRKVYAWGQEKLKFAEGDKFPVVQTKFGKIGMQICYDVEYPEPSRVQMLKGAEIVFVSAVWGNLAEPRWHIDLAGNALFNLMYMVGANPVGNDCCGQSKIVGPDGLVRAEAPKEGEMLLVCTVDLNDVLEVRSRIPYVNDFKKSLFSMDAVQNY